MAYYIKFFLFSLVIILVIEVSLRVIGFGDPPIAIKDTEMEYYPKPNMTYSRFNNKIEINRYGMRSHDFSSADKFDFEISIFGDSIIYGNHFLDQKVTIASRLRAHFAKETNLSTRISSIAASSWGPENIEAYIKNIGVFPGNVAVLVQSSHDRVDVIPCEPTVITPYRTSPSLTAISDILLAIFEIIRSKSIGSLSNCEALGYEDRIKITSNSLNRIILNLKQNYGRVIFIFHPTIEQVVTYKSKEDTSELFYRELAALHSIEYINSTEYYYELAEPADVFQDSIHLSKYGTLQFAQMLLEQLEK